MALGCCSLVFLPPYLLSSPCYGDRLLLLCSEGLIQGDQRITSQTSSTHPVLGFTRKHSWMSEEYRQLTNALIIGPLSSQTVGNREVWRSLPVRARLAGCWIRMALSLDDNLTIPRAHPHPRCLSTLLWVTLTSTLSCTESQTPAGESVYRRDPILKSGSLHPPKRLWVAALTRTL